MYDYLIGWLHTKGMSSATRWDNCACAICGSEPPNSETYELRPSCESVKSNKAEQRKSSQTQQITCIENDKVYLCLVGSQGLTKQVSQENVRTERAIPQSVFSIRTIWSFQLNVNQKLYSHSPPLCFPWWWFPLNAKLLCEE